jgi:hypothetical protein
MSRIHRIPSSRGTTRGTRAVWAIQIVLALLFLFAGGMKLVMPAAVLAQVTGLPGAFMKFIAVAEVSGALGLVLPGLFRVQQKLTPLAAVGLVTIMSGAAVVTLEAGQGAAAAMPLVVGCLAAFVAHRRRSWLASPTAAGGRAALHVWPAKAA